jgi:FkbM family methyltransferase
MKFIKVYFNLLKYKLIRFIEKSPKISIFIYNNIYFFKYLLPHEKDYFGLKKIIRTSDVRGIFLDVGANLGISTLGFIKLGYKNPIYLFEPNKYLYKNYLIKLKNKYKQIRIFNFALGKKEESREIFQPFYKNKCIHFLSSFNKKYLMDSLNLIFKKNISKKFIINKFKIKIKKFDSLKLNNNIKFIKIDVEGFDHFVIMGMKNLIKKSSPIILVEFNKENFYKIKSILRNYNPYIYDYKLDRFERFKKTLIDKKIARMNNYNTLTIRNIFFLPNKSNVIINNYSSL